MNIHRVIANIEPEMPYIFLSLIVIIGVIIYAILPLRKRKDYTPIHSIDNPPSSLNAYQKYWSLESRTQPIVRCPGCGRYNCDLIHRK